MKTIAWDLWLYCNYDCSFCNTKTKIIPNNIYGVDKIYKVWEQIYNRFGQCKICITGGEPLLYPNIDLIVKKLEKIHFLHITTNLSMDINFLENNEIDRKNIFLNITFHPYYISINEFIEKVMKIKEYGYNFSICYMGDKTQLFEFINYKKVFNKNGFDITLVLNDEKNCKLLNNFIDNNVITLYNKKIDNIQVCNAGVSYACVDTKGDAFSCSIIKYKLGNIFDNTFSFLEKKIECNGVCRLSENKY